MRKTHEDTHYASATFRCLKKIYQVPGLYCTDLHGWHTQLQGLWARASCCCSGQGEACGSRWGPSFCSLIMTSQNLALFQVCPYLLIYPWSFYRGRVYVGVKYLVLEPSSPLRHIAVLKQILLDEDLLSIPILCLFSDVGPYHRLTYLSVQLSLICLFFEWRLWYIDSSQNSIQWVMEKPTWAHHVNPEPGTSGCRFNEILSFRIM